MVVVHIKVGDEEQELFGVFESREKYLEEIKPHLWAKGIEGPIDWAAIRYRSAVLYATEVEMNEFQESL
jgi:hypothetical protein